MTRSTVLTTLFFLITQLFCVTAIAASAEAPIILEKARINPHDQQSIERGADFFAKNCLSCHSMRYLAHNAIAARAGITLDKMPLKNQEWWLGIAPPDLTLIARVRGTDWLYTYFHSFYQDASRPTGYNNLLAPNVVMTNVFAGLQGVQQKIPTPAVNLGEMNGGKAHYYTLLTLSSPGSVSMEQFHQDMIDLTNFLAYAADPTASERLRLGKWVLLLFAVLAVLAYLLKKSYWQDFKSKSSKRD